MIRYVRMVMNCELRGSSGVMLPYGTVCGDWRQCQPRSELGSSLIIITTTTAIIRDLLVYIFSSSCLHKAGNLMIVAASKFSSKQFPGFPLNFTLHSFWQLSVSILCIWYFHFFLRVVIFQPYYSLCFTHI